ncbi:MAG: hypothetical protein Kow0022_12130 [Phycisphaerales bacterium]
MEHEAPSTERSPFSRIEAVRESDCDELVDLFLGETRPMRHQDSDSDTWTDSRLDLVVAAHLDDPDAAFEQFCESIAGQTRDALGCVRHAGVGWVAWVHGRRVALGEHRASISTAVADVSRRCPRVLIVLPRQDEIGRLIAGLDGLADPPDSIIILCTTREPDVVASYRQAKSIAALAPAELERVRFAVVGDDAEQAQSALTRLTDTADRFLHTFIGGSCHVSKGPGSTRGHTDLNDAAADLLATPESRDATPGGDDGAVEHRADAAETPAVEPVAAETDPLDRLVRQLPGLDRVRVRVDGAGPVAIAVDASGQLHAVVGVFEHADWAEVHHPQPERALTLAEAFIGRHRTVLGGLDHRLESAPPTLIPHVIADRFSTLSPLIGGRTRLHLAVAVQVGQSTHWGVSELTT